MERLKVECKKCDCVYEFFPKTVRFIYCPECGCTEYTVLERSDVVYDVSSALSTDRDRVR